MNEWLNKGDSLNEDSGNGDGSDFFAEEPVDDMAPVTADTPKNKKPEDKNNAPKAQMKPADNKNQPKPKPKNNDNDY